MSPKAHRSSGILKLCLLGLALGAAGCSADDIQLNGGIFDAVGLSDATQTKSSEPKLAERAPLVVPPKLDNLPPPGEPPAAENSQLAGIRDPDAIKKASQEELQRQQVEYCDKNYDPNNASTESAEGPLGPCRKSILSAIKKWNSEE